MQNKRQKTQPLQLKRKMFISHHTQTKMQEDMTHSSALTAVNKHNISMTLEVAH